MLVAVLLVLFAIAILVTFAVLAFRDRNPTRQTQTPEEARREERR